MILQKQEKESKFWRDSLHHLLLFSRVRARVDRAFWATSFKPSSNKTHLFFILVFILNSSNSCNTPNKITNLSLENPKYIMEQGIL